MTATRRYCLRKAQLAAAREDTALERAWWAKQDGLPGTALPAAFPCRAALIAARYSTTEDLDGADADELITHAGLTRAQATVVLAAIP